MNRPPVDREDVEDDEHHVDPTLAEEHPIAEAREARQAILAERDELAVDREAIIDVKGAQGGDDAARFALVTPGRSGSGRVRAAVSALEAVGVEVLGGDELRDWSIEVARAASHTPSRPSASLEAPQ